ncbi:MAG TPA: hypothetical protein VLT33_13160 [Labilithrix sp.]|nr:hypothetical protein [Labilithrix sp.]
MTPLERLLQDKGCAVDAEGALAFANASGAWLLLLPGDPLRPEVADLAVVLGALAGKFPHLRIAVAPEGDEVAMRSRFGVTTFPALLFVKGGGVVTTLSRMQSWATYEGAARALEGAS